MGPRLVQRCPRYRRFAGGLGCSPAAAPAAVVSASAAGLLPHCVFWMRFPGSSWRNPLLLRLCSVEVSNSATEATPHHVSPASKKVVTKLASLFSLDAFGGGFLTDALVAYWFFRRFGVAEESLGLLFFAVHLLNAVSHLGAASLARRI